MQGKRWDCRGGFFLLYAVCWPTFKTEFCLVIKTWLFESSPLPGSTSRSQGCLKVSTANSQFTMGRWPDCDDTLWSKNVFLRVRHYQGRPVAARDASKWAQSTRNSRWVGGQTATTFCDQKMSFGEFAITRGDQSQPGMPQSEHSLAVVVRPC